MQFAGLVGRLLAALSAYVGALGSALACMVANLSAHKPGWDDRCEEFSEWAERAQKINEQLLRLVDEDTNAFNAIMEAYKMSKGNADEIAKRSEAIQTATKNAIEVPLQVMKTALQSFDVIKAMAETGNPNSVTDAGVGALCSRAAVRGAFLNVKVNAGSLKDRTIFVNMFMKPKDFMKADKSHNAR